MPRGDFIGARNQGLPARSRPSPTPSAAVLDRGRRLQPIRAPHPCAHHTTQPTKRGSGCRLCQLGLPCNVHRAQLPASSTSSWCMKSPLGRPTVLSPAESPTRAVSPTRLADGASASPELSWENEGGALVTAVRLEPDRGRVRHVDTGTPLCYSPAFEAYQFDIKDRWCTASCLCLHHAVAAGDSMLAQAASEGHLPFTRRHGLSERDEAGRTPAMVAAWCGAALALTVIAEGSNLDLVDKDGRTAFHWAALSPHPATMFGILCGRNCDMTLQDKNGETCVHKLVAQCGTGFREDEDVKACELLLYHEPRLALMPNRKGKRPYDLAKTSKMKAALSLQRAREMLDEHESKAKTEAMRLHEEAQREARRRKMEEDQAALKKKVADRARGGKKSRGKSLGSEGRDDWGIFYDKTKPADAVRLESENSQGADFFQEEHGFEVSYYQKIQRGEVQIDDLGDDHSFAEESAW